MKYRDYYEILGLQRDATQDGVKRAYRKLARKYHPDLSKQADAEVRFKEVGAAYNVLKDTEKRAAYDRMGSQWRDGQDFQPPPQWDENFEFTGKGNNGHGSTDFDDFFEAMFGGEHGAPHARHANGRARRADHGAQEAGDLEDAYSGGAQCPMPGQDHHARITIDLEEAYRGAQRAISLDTPVLDAQGHVSLQSRTLNVSIPKGMRSGQHLRLSAQGGAGSGQARAGDLYLEITLRDHPRFRVEGRDVSLDVPVAPWEAALGASVTVPLPDGSVDMTIPPDSGGGRRLRLKGKGIPGSPPGDLYVTLNIALPPAGSDSAKAAWNTVRQAFDFDPRADFYR
jgi:curved DNA-binding protein